MFLSQNQQLNVIQKLHSLATLPKSGCIAGQGLASIIYDELDIGVKAPINDLDIFDISSVRLYKALADSAAQSSLSFKGVNDQLSIVEDHYNQISYFSVRTQRGYKVVKSFIDKDQTIINKTLITFSDQSLKLIEQTFDHDTLLESFDFNACQVAYDLKSKKFYYTKAFETFLDTKILKLASLHTPLHSAIRLFKKVNEIAGAECDLEAEMNMITTYLSMHHQPATYAIPPMGKRYYELYKKYESDITPYFKIELDEMYDRYENPNLYSHKVSSLKPSNKTRFQTDLVSGVNFPAYYELIAGKTSTLKKHALTNELNDKCLNSRNEPNSEYETYGYAFFLIKLLANNNANIDEYSIDGVSEYIGGIYTLHSKSLMPYINYLNSNIQLGKALAPSSFNDSIAIINTIERLGNNGQWLKFLLTHQYISHQSIAPYTDEHILSLLSSFTIKAKNTINSKTTTVDNLITNSATFRGITNLYDYLDFCFKYGTSCDHYNRNEQLYIVNSTITNNSYLIRVYEPDNRLSKYTYCISHYYRYPVDKDISNILLESIHRKTRLKRTLWSLFIKPFVKIKINKELKGLQSDGGLSSLPF
jgi:hypothetical protein